MSITPKVGTSVRIKLEGNDRDTYRSRVADVDKKHLYLDIPVHPRSGHELDVKVKQNLRIEYLGSGSVVYKWTSPVLRKAYIPTPAIQVGLPDKAKDLERIQRREYFRTSLGAVVKITSTADGKQYVMKAVDVSGGGMAVKTTEEVTLSVNDYVVAKFTLPYSEYEIEVPCRIVRLFQDVDEEETEDEAEDGEGNQDKDSAEVETELEIQKQEVTPKFAKTNKPIETLVSMAFTDMKDPDRQQIVQYTFMRQRAQRRLDY
ncbi:flagellar brake protein [Alicyclobacillus dauci]|uniref:PilZ domain-containing protein n=1 Tax=Alicyclobacillus dauci TaxID=1475485 RepID=A0ABY6YX52_9BACL|nr:PilZ domain-containing protein [Alicyclobacillus dauci]WAH35087.1 PilZ domain-containing protein [Alicyclobacillus dauci]